MKFSLRSVLVSIITVSAVVLSPHVNAADFADTFSDASNVGNTFNGLGVNVSAGDLTLTRTASDVDMGLDWRPGSTGFFSLSQYSSFSLTATSAVNGGYYVVTAMFFNGIGDYVGESVVQTDSNAPGTYSYDLSSIGGGAEQWYARIRVNPYTYSGANPAFVFSEFSAVSAASVPEPSTYAMLVGVLSLGAVTMRRRRIRAAEAL